MIVLFLALARVFQNTEWPWFALQEAVLPKPKVPRTGESHLVIATSHTANTPFALD